LKECPPDKFPGPDGITNRMMKSSGTNFRQCLLIAFNTMWHLDCLPQAWQNSLKQPIFKVGDKDASDPASYRGIYLISALVNLVEGALVTRLTACTKTRNSLTNNQFGSRPDGQIHDTIYSLLFIIQYDRQCQKKPTLVAFIYYTTSYPSVFRQGLCHELWPFVYVTPFLG
jgi:hypothetical protein